jgi:WD40 repeat protein
VRYKAFISYSHTQRGLARGLQDALYRFGTPWHQRTGALIFRDESGLAANPDLWGTLRAALDESEYFIYMASPEAVRSPYTPKEIAYWISERGPEKIILAVAKGNARWDHDAGAFDPGSDSLPVILHTAFKQVPLFVDLRGLDPTNCHLRDPLFRDKVATIASALHGRSKDELYGMQVSALMRSEAELMARDAQTALAERSSDRALLLAAHALWMTEAQGEARVPEAEFALRRALCRAGGQPLGRLTAQTQRAYSLSFDGRWLCTVHLGDEGRLWALGAADDSALEPASVWHIPTPSRVRLSSDGSWAVAVREAPDTDAGTEVEIWSLRVSPPDRTAFACGGTVVAAEVSGEGEYLALSTVAPTSFQVWHLPTEEGGESGVPQPDAPSRVLCSSDALVERFALSTLGSALCTICGNDVTVWHLGKMEADVRAHVFHETAPIEDFHVSPAGDTVLMVANKTPQVVRLDAEGEPQRTVIHELDDDIVHRVEVSPDGRSGLLMSGSGPSYVVDLRRPTESAFMITSAGGTMNRHAFSRDGRWLATAAGPIEMYPELQVGEPEYVVRLRNLVIPTSLGEIELEGHEDLVTHVIFSPDGNLLATCSVDRSIRLWDLTELNALSELLAALLEADPETLIHDFGFPEHELPGELEKALERLQAHMVEAASRLRARRPVVLLADDAAPLYSQFTGDGSRLVSVHFISHDVNSARLWDVRANSPCAAPVRLSSMATIDNFALNQTCALSRDAKWLFVLETSALWALRSDNGTARERPVLNGTIPVDVNRAEFSRQGGFLMLSTGEGMLLVSLATDDATRRLDTGQLPVRRAFFTEDERWLLAVCGDKTVGDPLDVRGWRRQQGDDDSNFVAISGSRTLDLCLTSPEGRWLLASDDDGARVWDLGLDDPRHSERRLISQDGAVAGVCWAPDERSVFGAGADGRLLRWALSNSDTELEPEALHAVEDPLRSVTADWPRRRLLTCGANGRATLITLDERLAVAQRWDVPGLTGDVRGAFSPAGRWLSAWDGDAIRVFNIARGVERLELPHDPGVLDVRGAATYSSDERWLVVSRQGRLFLVDLGADASVPPIELRGHRHQEISFRITSDAHWLVSIDRPMNEPAGYAPVQTCRIWDLWSPDPGDSCIVLPELDTGVDRIDVTSDLRWLITSSRDGVRAWPVGVQYLLAVAQRAIGREPTEEERQRYSFTTFEARQAEVPFHLA